MQYGNGETQAPMYGSANLSVGMQRGLAPVTQVDRLPAAGLLNTQIEEVAGLVADVTKMAREVESRLVGSIPTAAQAETTQGPPSGGAGLLGSASARLYDVRTVLAEAQRALQRLMAEV